MLAPKNLIKSLPMMQTDRFFLGKSPNHVRRGQLSTRRVLIVHTNSFILGQMNTVAK